MGRRTGVGLVSAAKLASKRGGVEKCPSRRPVSPRRLQTLNSHADLKDNHSYFDTCRIQAILSGASMPSDPIPLPVERALRRLGHDLSLARRRRHLSQQSLAERIGASVNTVRRMEAGHPGTALQHLARALQVFGELDKLDQLVDTAHDTIGLALMDARLPQRIRSSRRTPDTGAF
jgi:DNA-binding XRE family transcriptional regulator